MLWILKTRGLCSSTIDGFKVTAIVIGKVNSGKSTFINKMCRSNLLLTSHRVNSTNKMLKAKFMYGGVEINVCDTPGLLEKHEKRRYRVSKNSACHLDQYISLENPEVVIAVADAFEYPLMPAVLQENLKESKNLHSILVLNKVDRFKDLPKLIPIIEQYTSSPKEADEYLPHPRDYGGWDQFQHVFTISAREDHGMKNVLDAIVSYAKPAKLDGSVKKPILDASLDEQVAQLARAQLFQYLTEEVPYKVLTDAKVIRNEPLYQHLLEHGLDTTECPWNVVITYFCLSASKARIVDEMVQSFRVNIESRLPEILNNDPYQLHIRVLDPDSP